jgi:short-subunit dehydrogenase
MEKRKEKIRHLKTEIKKAQQAILNEINNVDLKNDTELLNEEQENKRKSFQETLQINNATIKGLKEELKLTRMNKHSSEFFEWIPSLPNRRMRRLSYKRNK